MEFKEKLMSIQNELKAPKSRRNTFANYNYRSCEDILDAVKPLLKKYGCVLMIRDDVEHIGERFYIKATAYLEDTESDRFYSVSAYAREDDQKKGLDASQLSGSTSSYARKYALNGLFLIDDSKDADTDEFSIQNATQRHYKAQDTAKAENANTAYFCECCGKRVPPEIAEGSMKANAGKIYCSGKCRDKAMKAAGGKKDAE